MKMNKNVKQKWVKALKSDKYKQGKGALCHGNQNGTKYCCLGVLSDLAVKEKVCSRRTAFKGNSRLSDKVRNWAGVEGSDPEIDGISLSYYNDWHGYSFSEIASLIEKNL